MTRYFQWVSLILLAILFSGCKPAILSAEAGPKEAKPEVQAQDTFPSKATQTTTQISQATPTPDRIPTTLQHFPLFPGNTWTYSYTDYDPDPNDPNKTVQAVFEITRTVTGVKTLNGDYYAHIQNHGKKISQDPGWDAQQTPSTDYSFWFIIRGNQIYSGPESDSPETLPKDQLTLEFVFPMAKDAEWCPNPVGKASVDDPATSVPCNPIGKRVVLAEIPYSSAAGNYDRCYQMTDIYNSDGAIQTFCDGVGLVEIKYDHAGTRFGFLQALTGYQRGDEGSQPTVVPSITPNPGVAAVIPSVNTAASTPYYTCQESGPSAALMITNTMPIKDTTSCLFTSVPIKVYAEQALGGFTLTYPEDWKLSMTEDGQERFIFSEPVEIRVIHTTTDFPLSRIEQSRRVYEFVSLPVVSAQEKVTARHAVTLGKHSAVLLDTSVGERAIRRYWVKSEEPNFSGQFDLLIFEIEHFAQDADAFPARVSAVEALISSLQFSPANTHVIDLSPFTPLPTRPVQLPNGVLIRAGDGAGENGTLQAITLNGQVLGKLNLPGLSGIENFHVVGPFIGDVSQLQIVTMDDIPSAHQVITIYQGENILKHIPAPWVMWVNAAQESPLLAYVTEGSAQSQPFGVQLFYGKVADFPVKPLEDYMTMITGLSPYPYSLYAQDGQAKGLWLTQRGYGVGDFGDFPGSSLTYVDIAPQPDASPSRHQVLPDGVSVLGGSFDYTYVAYQSVLPELHILNLQTKKDVAIPMDAGSEGTGSARFSPENASVAWMEKSGSPDTTGTGAPTLHSQVRIASQAGEILVDLKDQQFASAAGFSPNWVEPLGWLDDQTLLVQASEYMTGKPVLLKLHLPDGQITLFAQGTLVDFLYP